MDTPSHSLATTLVFFVNGKKIVDDAVDPEWTLLRYLREKLRLPGAKMACGEGSCGACTVMVSKMDRSTNNVRHFSVNACLTPIAAMHGLSVTTTEGIGSTKTRLHPVQERLAKAHGSQCGFCTPGFVMSMYTLLRNNPKPTMEEIEDSLVGNLCRCTGYRPILEGFRTFSKQTTEVNDCGRTDCCRLSKATNDELNGADGNGHINSSAMEKTAVLYNPKEFLPYDPSQEVIFPPELKISPQYDSQNLVLKGTRSTFYRPVTLKEVLKLKKLFPDAKIVLGNTNVGIEVKFKNQDYPVIIRPTNIPELLQIGVKESNVEVGAGVSFSDIDIMFKNIIADLPEYKTRILRSILDMLKWFGSCQIKNVGTLGGNIMTGSPISDLNPILMAAGARLVLKSQDNEREVTLDDTFFTGYRTNIARKDEVLVSVKIPFTTEGEYFMAYKQERRKDVNTAMKASFEPGTAKVTSITLAFGGMAPTTVMAKETMKNLIGCEWGDQLVEKASSFLMEELKLEDSAPGGRINYRRALTLSFFFKFYLHVRHELHLKNSDIAMPLTKAEEKIIKPFEKKSPMSTQFCQNVPKGQEKIDPIGRPIVHVSSLKQTSGEATFIDDLPHFEGELYGAVVISSRAYAKILSIDDSELANLEGVKGFYSSRDLAGAKNICTGILLGEQVFSSEHVDYVGQLIGIVVATEESLAQRAAKKIKIHYEDLPNPILTIEEAIEANSMIGDPMVVESENVNEGFHRSEHTLEGEMHVGGQEHFYLEPNAHIAIPHEDDEMEMLSPSQSPKEMQASVAKALGIPANRVTIKVRRIGGGFGGKESRNIRLAAAAAIAASALQQPVRLVLDRGEDMIITGGRHPFMGRWKVGFNKDGTVRALEMEFYSNAGYSPDLSEAVMKTAILSCNTAYKIDNLKVSGRCCRTNLASNTAFRGLGNPQATLIMESVMSAVADFLKLDVQQVREKNMYGKSVYKTHFGQEIANCTVKDCWDQVLKEGKYNTRRKHVDEYNSQNTFTKRGLSAVPLKFCVGFMPRHLNQGGALVLVYTDGSVLLSHGGVEMGQGLHTKMIQVASRVLGVPMETIYIAETATDKVPNTSATAASISSDINGMAVLEACTKITERLKPYKERMPKGTWKDWVCAAYIDRVPLSATGFFKTPDDVDFCFKEQKPGNPYYYFAYGVGLSEVEIDCLTGDHRVLRTDIVMDVGNSLNPAIDIGQIEGAFMQGYGLVTTEQLLYSSKGDLLTKGPGTYKIPSVMDIPREFNVSLLRDSSEPRAVFSSKAVGEPPLLSAISVFYAIRDAVKAARGDAGKTPLRLDSPATAERIRMACTDWITQKADLGKQGRNNPWTIDASS